PAGAVELPDGTAPARCLCHDCPAGAGRHRLGRAPASPPAPAPAQGAQDLLLLTHWRAASGLLLRLGSGAQLGTVCGHVEHLAGAGVLVEQAETAGDFLVGFLLAAEAAAEAVLVELLAAGHVPQPAVVGADFVGEDHPAVVV